MRVNLLPREYHAELKERSSLRVIALCVVGVLLVGVAGSFGAGMLAQEARADLAAEQQRGADLRAERLQYSELTGVLAELDTADAARTIALYAEVDWSRVHREFEAALPGDASTTALNLGQRLSPSVSGNSLSDGTEANPLSQLSPVFVEYQIKSSSVDAGDQLLDRLVDQMTGYEWASQTSVQRDGDGVFTFAGVLRLGMPAIGTARADQIDEATLEALRESFARAATDESAIARGVQ